MKKVVEDHSTPAILHGTILIIEPEPDLMISCSHYAYFARLKLTKAPAEWSRSNDVVVRMFMSLELAWCRKEKFVGIHQVVPGLASRFTQLMKHPPGFLQLGLDHDRPYRGHRTPTMEAIA